MPGESMDVEIVNRQDKSYGIDGHNVNSNNNNLYLRAI
jgi:hypothetical protein